jgi:hypothetical protein
MKLHSLLLLLLFCQHVEAVNDQGLDKRDVIPAVRFLENEPLSKDAPLSRALLLRWEENNAAEADILVCPDLLTPLPDPKIQYSAELTAQYLFGILAFQLAHPAERNHANVFPGQLAGIRSALRSYQAIVALKTEAHIPEYDELLKHEREHTLEAHMRPLISAKCSWPKK